MLIKRKMLDWVKQQDLAMCCVIKFYYKYIKGFKLVKKYIIQQ